LTNARGLLSTLVLAASLAACGSSSNEPVDTGARPDAKDGAADAEVDVGVGADAGGDALDAEPPFVPPSGTRRLVSGSAALIGSGSDSCTNQPGVAGDRWCAFLVPSKTAGRFELWVIDATEAASGTDIACDGSDAYCLRIATDAFHLDGAGSLDGGFAGDTLLYRRGPDATVVDGPIWAWRPGWTTGRELVTGLGTACFAAPNYASAFCLRTSTAAAGSEATDLVAGLLDAPSDGDLALVDTIVTSAPSDPAGSSADLELGFSPDGMWVAWSTVGVPSAQGLKVQKIGSASAPIPTTTDVSQWQMSGDESAWVWLRSYTDSIIAPSGTLETAAFPDGTGVTTLEMNVADYEPVGAKGLLVRANVADQVGDLRYMPDLTTPASSVLLDQGVRTVVARSADASTVIYTKVSTAVGVDLYAWSASLAAPCTLTSTPAAFSIARLMASNRVVVWARRDVISQAVSGAITTLASCATQSFGQDLIQSMPASDGRLLYIDGAPSGSTSGTLRVATIAADGAGLTGTPLQRNVDLVFAPIAPNAVFYTLAGNTGSSGLYIYAGALLGN
jgi:hypothetical protein